jgi:6-phosphogluconate dehydrogenase
MQIGIVGLGRMGANIARRLMRSGHQCVVFDANLDASLALGREGAASSAALQDLVKRLSPPRVVWLMVPAAAVDGVLDELLPHLAPGDIVVDGGNSYFRDTERRSAELAARDLLFVGMGVSGGELGALWGPSLMPGGPIEAYKILEPMLTSIAAKSQYGPCVSYIGPGGSGHYVKMVHNGIEYGDMQLIAETYDIMRSVLKMPAEAIADDFSDWNTRALASYLIEVTSDVLRFVDDETHHPLVDLILDAAEQKGTGRWTIESAMELNSPVPTIDAAVTARMLSAQRALRLQESEVLESPPPGDVEAANALLTSGGADGTNSALEAALYFAKISSYAQGMALLAAASEAYSWDLNLSEIARIWTGGCIIRAAFLAEIMRAFGENPELPNLLLDPRIAELTNQTVPGARRTNITARAWGVPTPGMSSALDYFDTLRQPQLPTNLIQAQRDYFGAHTYQRQDREGIFHTLWHGEEQPAEPEPLQAITEP